MSEAMIRRYAVAPSGHLQEVSVEKRPCPHYPYGGAELPGNFSLVCVWLQGLGGDSPGEGPVVKVIGLGLVLVKTLSYALVYLKEEQSLAMVYPDGRRREFARQVGDGSVVEITN